MARPGPRKIRAYSLEFKLTAVRLSEQPGIQVQAVAAGRLLAAVPEERRDQCWWLVLPDGTPVPGDGGGGVMLLAPVRLTKPLGRMVGALRPSPVIDTLDALIARHRKGLGGFVPDGSAPRRYP